MDALLQHYYAPLENLLSRENLLELSVIGEGQVGFESVSYTHLTLPTIYSV